jgi:hypothetical protein
MQILDALRERLRALVFAIHSDPPTPAPKVAKLALAVTEELDKARSAITYEFGKGFPWSRLANFTHRLYAAADEDSGAHCKEELRREADELLMFIELLFHRR